MKSTLFNLLVALVFLGSHLSFCAGRTTMHNSPKRSPNRVRRASESPAPRSRTPMTPAALRSPSPSPLLGLRSQNQPSQQQHVLKKQKDLDATAKGFKTLADELSKLEKQEDDLRNQETYSTAALEKSLIALEDEFKAGPQPQQEGYIHQTNNLMQRLRSIWASINHQKMLHNRSALEKIGFRIIALQKEKENLKQQTSLSIADLQRVMKANKMIETDLLVKANNDEYPQDQWTPYEINLLKRLTIGQEKLFTELETLQKTAAHNQRQLPRVPTFDSNAAPQRTATPAPTPALVAQQPAAVQPPTVVPCISSPFKAEHSNQIDVAPAGFFAGSPVRPVYKQPLASTISEAVLLTPGIGRGFKEFKGVNQVDLGAQGSFQQSSIKDIHKPLAEIIPDTPVTTPAPAVASPVAPAHVEIPRHQHFPAQPKPAFLKRNWKFVTICTLAIASGLAGGEIKYKLLTRLGTRLFHGATVTGQAIKIAQPSWLTKSMNWLVKLLWRRS